MNIKPHHAKIVSFILGVFFIVAGIGKMLETHVFVTDIESYGIPDKLSWIAILVPTFEVMLGFLLVFFIQNKQTSLVSLVTMVLFTLGFAYGHFVSGAEDCGCFGAFEALSTPPWVSFLRNFILIAMSFLLFKNPVKNTNVIPQWQWAVMLVSLLVSGIYSGQTSVAPTTANTSDAASTPLTDPNDPLLNKNVSQTPLNDLASFEQDKRYLVFIFSPSCPHCWDATENVKAFKESGLVDEIYGMVSQEAIYAKDVPMYKERFKPNFEVTLIPHNSLLQMTNAFPKILFIKNNTVKYIMSSDIKSPWTMYQMLMTM